MARKSRKQIAVEEPVVESVSSEVFSTAIYARLSVENSGKSEKVDVMDDSPGQEHYERRNLYRPYHSLPGNEHFL